MIPQAGSIAGKKAAAGTARLPMASGRKRAPPCQIRNRSRRLRGSGS